MSVLSSQTSTQGVASGNVKGRLAALLLTSCAVLAAVSLNVAVVPSGTVEETQILEQSSVIKAPAPDAETTTMDAADGSISGLQREEEERREAERRDEEEPVAPQQPAGETDPLLPPAPAAAPAAPEQPVAPQQPVGHQPSGWEKIARFFGSCLQGILSRLGSVSFSCVFAIVAALGFRFVLLKILEVYGGGFDLTKYDARVKTGEEVVEHVESGCGPSIAIAGVAATWYFVASKVQSMQDTYRTGEKQMKKAEKNQSLTTAQKANFSPKGYAFSFFFVGKIVMVIRLFIQYLGFATAFSFADFMTYFGLGELLMIGFAALFSFPIATLTKAPRKMSKVDKTCATAWVYGIDAVKSILFVLPFLYFKIFDDTFISGISDSLGLRVFLDAMSTSVSAGTFGDAPNQFVLPLGQIMAFAIIHVSMDVLQAVVSLSMGTIWASCTKPGSKQYQFCQDFARCNFDRFCCSKQSDERATLSTAQRLDAWLPLWFTGIWSAVETFVLQICIKADNSEKARDIKSYEGKIVDGKHCNGCWDYTHGDTPNCVCNPYKDRRLGCQFEDTSKAGMFFDADGTACKKCFDMRTCCGFDFEMRTVCCPFCFCPRECKCHRQPCLNFWGRAIGAVAMLVVAHLTGKKWALGMAAAAAAAGFLITGSGDENEILTARCCCPSALLKMGQVAFCSEPEDNKFYDDEVADRFEEPEPEDTIPENTSEWKDEELTNWLKTEEASVNTDKYETCRTCFGCVSNPDTNCWSQCLDCVCNFCASGCKVYGGYSLVVAIKYVAYLVGAYFAYQHARSILSQGANFYASDTMNNQTDTHWDKLNNTQQSELQTTLKNMGFTKVTGVVAQN